MMPKIGWIGTGVMGQSMCKHLLGAGYSLSVYNRTASKASLLLEKGAKWMIPKQMAENVDILMLMLGFPKDIEQICFGQHGIIQYMRKGSILVDHTTSKPSLAMKIYEQGLKYQVGCVDAPVSGGDIGAKQGKLVTMCGADHQIWEKVKPIMQNYSKSVEYNGGPGKGQHTKMANQIVLAGNMAGMVEGLMYASKMGLNLTHTIETISHGAASSVSLSVMGKRIVAANYQPGFYVEHYIKDMEIALEEASRCGLSLPCLAIVKQFYVALQAQGGGRLGTQALIKVLENLNNHKLNINDQK